MIIERPQWFQVLQYWPSISGGVERALEHNAIVYSAEDVLRGLMNRDMELWLAKDGGEVIASMVTQVCNLPNSRVLTVITLAGERMTDFLENGYALLEEYAREKACDWLEVAGRKGWERVLSRYGWEPATMLYRKKL